MRVTDPYTPLRDIHDRYDNKSRGKSTEYDVYFDGKKLTDAFFESNVGSKKRLAEFIRVWNLKK